MNPRLSLIPLGLVIALAGCGSSGGAGDPDTIVNSAVPVSGKVLLPGGQPAANAWVVFNAKDPPGNDASAATAADGSFRLGTFKKEDGAVPGRYVVTVEPHPHARGAKPRIPKAYQSAETSPLRVEITAGAANELQPLRLK